MEAFNNLILNHHQRGIRVADVIARAGVGRSTFYEHYGGIGGLQLEALKTPFAALADAAAGGGDRPALTSIFAHFWEHRQLARTMLTGTAGEAAQRLLADLVADRIGSVALALPARLAAEQLAAAALAPVRAWLLGTAPCKVDALAAAICATGAASLEALHDAEQAP